MKRILFVFSLALLFIACDTEEDKQLYYEYTLVKWKVRSSEDLMKLCDMKITYDIGGQKKTVICKDSIFNSRQILYSSRWNVIADMKVEYLLKDSMAVDTSVLNNYRLYSYCSWDMKIKTRDSSYTGRQSGTYTSINYKEHSYNKIKEILDNDFLSKPLLDSFILSNGVVLSSYSISTVYRSE